MVWKENAPPTRRNENIVIITGIAMVIGKALRLIKIYSPKWHIATIFILDFILFEWKNYVGYTCTLFLKIPNSTDEKSAMKNNFPCHF